MAEAATAGPRPATPEVTVYTTRTCVYCTQAKAWLRERGVPFREVDVSRDRQALLRMAQLSGQTGTPVITVDSQVVVGFDRLQLARLLPASGTASGAQPAAPAAAPRAQLGAAVATLTPSLAAERGLPAIPGVLVGSVTPGGPAHAAGLQPGDVVIEANGWTLSDRSQLERMIQQAGDGGSLELTVWRGGQRVRVTLAPSATAPAQGAAARP
jgi:S1-C subfamily serine protease